MNLPGKTPKILYDSMELNVAHKINRNVIEFIFKCKVSTAIDVFTLNDYSKLNLLQLITIRLTLCVKKKKSVNTLYGEAKVVNV